MRGLLLAALLLASGGCLRAWDLGGPWSCGDGFTCADGLVCDDGVCCAPGGQPACPTLPLDGNCPGGQAPRAFVRDVDGDGAGDDATRRLFCHEPQKERWVTTGGDCDDANAAIGPNALERCNAIDDDCDGAVDNGLPLITWYRDDDGDGFGVDGDTRQACVAPPGYVASSGDCAPGDAERYPGAPERCNGVDDNCNGQLDDPPFIDVENPGQDGGSFPCDTGRPGVCQPGGLQCVFQPGQGFAPTCISRVAPSPDVCGNGLDEDCNGVADDRPGCGGPANFLATPGLSFGAFTFAPTGGIGVLPTTCQRGRAGVTDMGWLSPTWIGSGSDLHVWWVEAPPGETWDVSTATSLYFAVRNSPINPAASGTWGAGRFPNAVVALCGPNNETLRYVPSGAALVSQAAINFAVTVPLRPATGSPWTVTGNLQATLPRIKRVEVWMSPQDPGGGLIVTFSNRFLTDAGVPGFR